MDTFSRGRKLTALAIISTLENDENDKNKMNVISAEHKNLKSDTTTAAANPDNYLSMQQITEGFGNQFGLENVIDRLKQELLTSFEEIEIENIRREWVVDNNSNTNDVPLLDISQLDIVDENLIPLANYQISGIEENPNRGKLVLDHSNFESSSNTQTETEEDVFAVKATVTKSGDERKRRLFVKTKEERRKFFEEKRKAVHSLKRACDKCRMQCSKKIDEADRIKINGQFWNLSFYERKLYVINQVEVIPVKRRRKETNEDEKVIKENSLVYRLKNRHGNLEQVCKKFFLSTLGFQSNNDSILKYIYKKNNNNDNYSIDTNTPRNSMPKTDQRGGCRKKVIDKSLIKDHIQSYCPNISHYRREHAPQRLYLPSDIKIIEMYKNFLEKHPTINCSYELYRGVVSNDLNISFTTLGHEKCEKCEIFELHNRNHKKNDVDSHPECNECVQWSKHVNTAKMAREAYRQDVDGIKQEDSNTRIIFSADMQKIIMLPRIDMFKQVVFCPRLIVFNETFVPVGRLGKTIQSMPFSAIWHEATSGRKKEDVVSTFHAFFLHVREYKNITLWLDNCTGQNKNWCLFSFLVYVVNSDEVAAYTITFKYFEPGHTYMSADSFHHQVENGLRKKQKIYDFMDFVNVVKECNSAHVCVKEMNIYDFRNWPDLSSNYQLQKGGNETNKPILKDIYVVQARRGFKTLYYKNSFADEEFKEMNFLAKKHMKKNLQVAETLTVNRGITSERKENIIKKLGSLMEPHKLKFWKELPTTNEAEVLD